MIIKDRRTPEQKKTHKYLVCARDKAMSGWGMATRGNSYVAWAFDNLAEAEEAMGRIQKRPEMLNVRLVVGYWRPRGTGHTSIYVKND